MPILCENVDNDKLLIESLADEVCRFWNENGGIDHGVKLFVGKDKIEEVSVAGDAILASFFADPPGPFKRLATLLVLARLDGLFTLAAPSSDNVNLVMVNSLTHRQWLARICYLLIEPTFFSLTVKGEGGKEYPLTEWKDFPSIHSKAEFISWLEWLCDYPHDYFPSPQRDVEKMNRRGRMILATSLILEAVYYQNHASANICGICDKVLLDDAGGVALLKFDQMLRFTELERMKKTG